MASNAPIPQFGEYDDRILATIHPILATNRGAFGASHAFRAVVTVNARPDNASNLVDATKRRPAVEVRSPFE